VAEADGLQGLGRRSALGLVGALVNGVATIASVLIASKTLSAVEVGQFFVAISLFALAQGICSIGIETGLSFWIPAIGSTAMRSLVRRCMRIATALGLVAALVVIATASPLARFLDDTGNPQLPDLLRTLAVMLPFAGLYEVVFGALRSLERMFLAVVVDRVIRPLAQVAAMVLVAATGGGATALTIAWVAPIVVATVGASGALVTMRYVDQVADARPELPSAEFWGYTTPRAVARIAQVATQRLDVILLAGLASVEDAGVYATVSRCMIAGVFVATAVQQVIQPRLRKLVVRGELGAVKTMYGASTTWVVLATWPAYLMLAILSPFVLRIFGGDYERGATALTILSLTMVVASGCGLVDVVLLMVGKSWLSTGIVCSALALNVALNLALIGPLGMNGSAIAWSAAILTTNLVPLFVVNRLGLHPFGNPLGSAAAVCATCLAVPLVAGRLASTMSSADAIVAAIIAGVAYVAALFISRRAVLLDRFVADLTSRSPRVRAARNPEVTIT
jgi:O-antigen/teichoic acid export membrane protein